VRVRDLLAIADYRRLWLAQAISLCGDFLAMFAVQASVVFRLHGSAGDMAGVLLAALLPASLLGPVAGALVDRSRWSAQHVMVAADVARAALVALLPFTTNLWHICGISLLMSCCSCFFGPSQAVVVPSILQARIPGVAALVASSVWMQQTFQVVRIASPGLAGALAAKYGETFCYRLDAVSFLISVALLMRLGLRTQMRTRRQAPGGLLALREGMAFLWFHRELRYVVGALMLATFSTSCYAALISVYVRDVLRQGASTYGEIAAMLGAGSLAGSVLVKRVLGDGGPDRVRQVICYGLAVVSGAILFLVVAPAPVMASTGAVFVGQAPVFTAARSALLMGAPLLTAALMGAAGIMVITATGACLQAAAPMELRGRVSSTSAALMAIAQAAAYVGSGWLAARFVTPGTGARVVFGVSSALLLLPLACRCFRRETIPSEREACSRTQ
jgi:MFS family permease